ncbi:MAG: hypothetical protein HKN91_02625, partial [Acidimicrobiia bacterium]|nr:hypothetical protein [Acidimicrobiia bacterium]
MVLGHFGPGYDLIDDDANPSEVANGFDDDGDGQIDEAFGHGTFIAGLIAQIAPGAEVLPIPVLDADGQGGSRRCPQDEAEGSGRKGNNRHDGEFHGTR